MNSPTAAEYISQWLEDIASNEVKFAAAMQLLCNYSLVEDMQDVASYTTHPVVHTWSSHIQDRNQRLKLGQLAVIIVGVAVPQYSTREYSSLQRRLLPHAQVCSKWAIAGVTEIIDGKIDMFNLIDAERVVQEFY